jgi:hypothetical protein
MQFDPNDGTHQFDDLTFDEMTSLIQRGEIDTLAIGTVNGHEVFIPTRMAAEWHNTPPLERAAVILDMWITTLTR